MKNRKREHLTVGQIVDIYTMRKEGKKVVVITQKMDIPSYTISKVETRIDNYLARMDERFMRVNNYMKAARIIDKQLNTRISEMKTDMMPSLIPPIKTVNHRDKFKKAYEVFEHELSEFIESEVETRQQELIDENKQLKADILKMEQAFSEVKNSNWVDNLFGGKAKNHQ